MRAGRHCSSRCLPQRGAALFGNVVRKDHAFARPRGERRLLTVTNLSNFKAPAQTTNLRVGLSSPAGRAIRTQYDFKTTSSPASARIFGASKIALIFDDRRLERL